MLDKFVAVLLLPVFFSVTILLLIPQLVSYGRVFFRQERPGRDGKIFTLLKFQTMKSGSGPDVARLTFLGNIIRKLALDELPQLINILKGDMSFVGPRPLLPEYLPLYNENHRKRHFVKPGITGLAQISGGKIRNWQDKLDLDVHYIENLSFRLDLKIIIGTLALLIFKAGREKEKISTKFTGYEQRTS